MAARKRCAHALVQLALVIASASALAQVSVTLHGTELTVADRGTELGRSRAWLAVADATAGPFVDVPLEATASGVHGALPGLELSGRWSQHADAMAFDGEVVSTDDSDRALIVRVSVPVEAIGWVFEADWSGGQPVTRGKRFEKAVTWPAGRSIALFPWCGVGTGDHAVAIAVPPDEPRVFRLAYESVRQSLEAEFELGLAPTAGENVRRASFHLLVFTYDGRWGFRSIIEEYGTYTARPPRYAAGRAGIWLLGFDPAGMTAPWDFGLRFDEGGAAHAGYDVAHDILPLVYTEPWGKYEHFANSPVAAGASKRGIGAGPLSAQERHEHVTRDLDVASDVRDRHFGSRRDVARAIVNSAIEDRDGNWVWRHWTDEFSPGDWLSNVTLNPSPALPEPNRSSVTWAYEIEPAEVRAQQAGGELGGIYLDSISDFMGFSTENYRRSQWRVAQVPLVVSADRRGPAQLHAFAAFEFAKQLARTAHGRGWLVLGNTERPNLGFFAPVLDVIGAGERAALSESSRDQYRYVRTYAADKPASLMSYGFVDPHVSWRDKERALTDGLLYAIFPGTGPFRDPARYEPSRPLYRYYLPILSWMDEASWHPVTRARARPSEIGVERYGPGTGGVTFLALRNQGSSPVTATVDIERAALPAPFDNASDAWAFVSDRRLRVTPGPGGIQLSVPLAPERTEVVAIGSRAVLARLWLAEAARCLDHVGKEAAWIIASRQPLHDGSFEGTLGEWHFDPPDGPARLDCKQPIAGRCSVRADSDRDGTSVALTRRVALAEGEEHALRFRYSWSRAEGQRGTVVARVGVDGPDGKPAPEHYIEFKDLEPTGARTVDYEARFTIPRGFRSHFLQFLMLGAVGTLRVDDVQVTPASVATLEARLADPTRVASEGARALRAGDGSIEALAQRATEQAERLHALRVAISGESDPAVRRALTPLVDNAAEGIGRAVEVATGVTLHLSTAAPFAEARSGVDQTWTIEASSSPISEITLEWGASSQRDSLARLAAGERSRGLAHFSITADQPFGWADVWAEARFTWNGQGMRLQRRGTVRLLDTAAP